MRALTCLALVAACTGDPMSAAERKVRGELREVNRALSPDGDPAFDLGSLSSAGPPGSPSLGGGLGSPDLSGGVGSPGVSGGLGSPAGGGGGVASGPSGTAPDQELVAAACDLFDALFERVARCSNDPTGWIDQVDQLFKGQTCPAYVAGILQIDPQPIQPGAIQLVHCMAALFRNTPCDYQTTTDMFLAECMPVGS